MLVVVAITIILFVLFGPPVAFWYIGRGQKEIGKNDKATLFYILAIVYLIIGLGVCGSMMG